MSIRTVRMEPASRFTTLEPIYFGLPVLSMPLTAILLFLPASIARVKTVVSAGNVLSKGTMFGPVTVMPMAVTSSGAV
ncbi:MAG TPA: hypothetical protein P5295_06890 [Spirochaetota bacterium]|nr:hypothetical protein [Spirochaetota bacterium]